MLSIKSPGTFAEILSGVGMRIGKNDKSIKAQGQIAVTGEVVNGLPGFGSHLEFFN